MSSENDQVDVEKEEEVETNYQPPPQKTIEEIIAADQEDESLRRYKEALLGAAQSERIIVGTFAPIYSNAQSNFFIILIIFYFALALKQMQLIHGKWLWKN